MLQEVRCLLDEENENYFLFFFILFTCIERNLQKNRQQINITYKSLKYHVFLIFPITRATIQGIQCNTLKMKNY
jgi:hypothetical protein